MVAVSAPTDKPRAVVLYLHTLSGDYTQLAHFADHFWADNIAYVTYTRTGNDCSLPYRTFNFVGRIEELQIVLRFIRLRFPGVGVHAVEASAESALLIRFLGKHNSPKLIQSAVLVSPGYNFMQSLQKMSCVEGLSRQQTQVHRA